ncbi:P27 family phage terminase small subunit [Tropicibacter sp. Alg240-R139]|uniref:P27 family phage terminase small subunit n=1 Tax=Tropicibacter sp. Alg240-R139 TaxID=2305991 RepID=UPI001F081EE1
MRETERHIQKHNYVIEADGAFKRNPSVGIQQAAIQQARLLAAELGMTPVPQSRPTIREDGDADSLVD